jgi:hypothetical protein
MEGPRDEWTVLVGTWTDGLFAITLEGSKQEISHQPVRGLASDGRNGALAIVGGDSLQRRAPDGRWTVVANSDFDLSCCVSVQGTIYVGTNDARILRVSHDDGVLVPVESFDTVPGRDTWFAGSAIVNGQRLGPPLGVRSIAASSNGSVLYANVHVGGIPRSLDGGNTWQPTVAIESDVHEVCAHPSDPNVVVAASALGLCISQDAGTTWTIEAEGLHANACYAVTFAAGDVLISSAVDPFASQGRIYRRAMQPEAAIVPVEGGLPAWTNGKVDTGCIASSGPRVALVDSGGTLYQSSDSGRTWLRSQGELPTPSSVLLC